MTEFEKLWPAEVNAAGLVVADGAIPTVAIAGYPRVQVRGEPVNSRNQQDPGEKIPTGQEQANLSPGVSTFVSSALWIDGEHPFHCFCTIDLREALRNGGVVQVDELDSSTQIETTHTRSASAAKCAMTVKENRQPRHNSPAMGLWQKILHQEGRLVRQNPFV